MKMIRLRATVASACNVYTTRCYQFLHSGDTRSSFTDLCVPRLRRSGDDDDDDRGITRSPSERSPTRKSRFLDRGIIIYLAIKTYARYLCEGSCLNHRRSGYCTVTIFQDLVLRYLYCGEVNRQTRTSGFMDNGTIGGSVNNLFNLDVHRSNSESTKGRYRIRTDPNAVTATIRL